VSDRRQAPAEAALVVWGASEDAQGVEGHRRVIRLEDGFIRSVGLGAEFVQPLSWVADHQGMHYDASRPSDLEVLLQESNCTDEDLTRARSLRERLVGVTKYNVGAAGWTPTRSDRQVVLAVGQVESDAAIRFGAPGIRTNVALVKAARLAHPDAHLVYKPHPDVVAGLRAVGRGEHEASAWCDEIVVDASMNVVMSHVDAVHVITSLSGFEALLRGKKVVTHGQPFYSGWGLTCDVHHVVRRTRRLSLDELVYAALIAYPLYASVSAGHLTTPEAALDELLVARAQGRRCTRVRRAIARAIAKITRGVS
jgi:capsular polysaccharide export protein